MKNGSIRRIARERVVRRDDERLLTAWVGTTTATAAPARLDTTLLIRSDPAGPVGVDRGAPVLVMLPTDHAPALNELLAPASAGERVYVLAPTGWGQPKIDPQLLACRTVLIRRIPEVPVAGVYRASEAKIWMGAKPGGAAPWCLRLDGEQSAAFRQLFLRLFWHQATDEGWTGGKQIAFRPAGERPFDVPEPPRSAPLRLLGGDAPSEFDTRDALVHVSDGAPPSGTLRRLWFPISGSHHQPLARLVRDGAEVVWEDRQLPDLVIGKRKAVAHLPGKLGRLIVDLNSAQAADAARILEAPASWRFGTDLRIGDYAQSGELLWVDGDQAACPIEAEQSISLPDMQSEQLRATPEISPDSWPAAQPLALAARYKWMALPPRLPANSEEDPLVGSWRQLDEAWSTRRNKIRNVLQETDGHRSRVGRAFSRLLNAMLGFERTQRNLLEALTALDEKRLSSAGPAAAPALLQQLTSIEDQARALQGDQEEAERKAQEQEEREKQERDWKSRIEAASRDLPEHRKALTAKEALLPDLVKALDTLEAELKAADKKAKKDLQVQQQRTSDDLAKLKDDIKRLKQAVDALEQQVAEPFVFKPTTKSRARQPQGAGRFVPQTNQSRIATVIPEEALPEVGALRRHRGQRYLVIEIWEELTSGEEAAARLKARLVAPENA